MIEESNKEKQIYEVELSEYKTAQKNRKKNDETVAEEPTKPPYKVVYIPANTSYAAILKHIQQNDAKGIICETEADSIWVQYLNKIGAVILICLEKYFITKLFQYQEKQMTNTLS